MRAWSRKGPSMAQQPRSLDDMAAGKASEIEVKLLLGPKAYKNFDGCPFPLEVSTDDEDDQASQEGYHTFFIQFNLNFGDEERKELLEWFLELVKPSKPAKSSTEGEEPVPEPKASTERNALLFPASMSKQQRAMWHSHAQSLHLSSQSEGFGADRALRITPPQIEASVKEKRGSRSDRDNWRERDSKDRRSSQQAARKAKELWNWCQEEGGEYLTYSQGELTQLLEEATALPVELARLTGKRHMAERLMKAISRKDEQQAIALIEKDRTIVWIKDRVHTGGYPIHFAAWHGMHAIVATIIEQKTTLQQKDKESKTALQIARQRRHESIVKLLLGAGAEDPDTKPEVKTPSEAAASTLTEDKPKEGTTTEPKEEKAADIGIPVYAPPRGSASENPSAKPGALETVALSTTANTEKTADLVEEQRKAVESTGVGFQINPNGIVAEQSHSQKPNGKPAGPAETQQTGVNDGVLEKSSAKLMAGNKKSIGAALDEIDAVTEEWAALNEQSAKVLEQLAKILEQLAEHTRLGGKLIGKISDLKKTLSEKSETSD